MPDGGVRLGTVDEYNAAAERHWASMVSDPQVRDHLRRKPFDPLRVAAILRPDMPNVYFALTGEFNSEGLIAPSAGQAVVFYRIALMSKDGDWVLRETAGACRRVRSVLADHGARYRPGAPLDPRWLAGAGPATSSSSTKRNAASMRLREPPARIAPGDLDAMFAAARGDGRLRVVDLSLIRLKQTQRAKDYPVISELSRLLPPEIELRWTTDPDRIMELSSPLGQGSPRASVRAARDGLSREVVVMELAREIDRMQREDRDRMRRYEAAARPYLEEFRTRIGRTRPGRRPWGRGQCGKQLLPRPSEGGSDGCSARTTSTKER
jgi:hypothetical protein